MLPFVVSTKPCSAGKGFEHGDYSAEEIFFNYTE
jgi:hypothetical protein